MKEFTFDFQRFAYTVSSSNTVYSGSSYDDRIVDRGSNVSIDASYGDDVIDLDPYFYGSVQNVTLTGGSGNDTFVIDPYNSNTISAVITDFTSNDVFVYDSDYDDSGNKKLTYAIENGNMVIRNNQSSSGSTITPTFVVTLKGVSSLSQISSAKYYRVTNWYTDGVSGYTQESSTFGELFANTPISNSSASIPVYGTSDSESITNTGGYVTIYAYGGDDTITQKGSDGLIFGGLGADYISLDHSDRDTIYGGDGNDTIIGIMGRPYITSGAGDDLVSIGGDTLGGAHTIRGGLGNDTLYGNSHSIGQTFVYESGDGYDVIGNYDSNDTISIDGSDKYMRSTVGSDVVVSLLSGGAITLKSASDKTINITGGTFVNIINNSSDSIPVNGTSGNDTIINNGGRVTINTYAGNDSITNNKYYVTINAGSGSDTVYNYTGDYVSINGGDGNDLIYGGGANWYVTVNAGDGDDTINNFSRYSSINGGAGADKISLGYCYETRTVIGGTGNDTIYGGSGSSYGDLYKYSSGDGYDLIKTWSLYDTLQIGNGTTDTYSKTKSGSNIIVTVGNGAITLEGAANLSSVNINGTEIADNTWKVSGTTATYGNSSKTLAKIKGLKSGLKVSDGKISGISLSGKVITLAKSVLGTSNVTLSGNYTLNLGNDVKNPSTTKKWYLDKTTAIYKQTTSEGYKLSSDAKSITHSDATSKNLITLKGLKSGLKVSDGKISGISLSGKIITLSKSVLGTSTVTVSGNYTLKLGSDVKQSESISKGWTKSDSTATYKTASTTEGYKLADNQISYVSASGGKTLATVKGVTSTDGLSMKNNIVTLKNASLKSKVTISGNYEFDFASDYKKATITGSSNSDTITARGKNLSISGGSGNDTLKILGSNNSVNGGDGADFFILSADKSNVITDYKAEDTISIASGIAKFTTSGKDVILTSGKGNITVTGGADKTLTYIDKNGKQTYSAESDEKVTLPKNYKKGSYTLSEGVQTVDASAVQRDLKINGNVYMNKIIGGAGNDTLVGGGSNDTLIGGKGSDVFFWSKGDGNDFIEDYMEEDTIFIKGDTVKNFTASSDDLIVNLSSKAKITVKGGADKIISYTDNKGEQSYSHFVSYTKNGKAATLKSNYPKKKSFEPDNYDTYIDSLVKINASKVQHGMNIVGNDLANSIFGTAEDDFINGGDGNDTIRGSDGNDSLFGGKGKDYLFGGEGNNTLWGGVGNDYLYGGEGSDIFIFDKNDGTDKIFSYEQGVDKIMILSGKKPVLAGTPLSNDLTFKVDNTKIVIDNTAHKTIEFVKSNGKHLYTHIPS